MATQPPDFSEFPPDIILKPQALVGLAGLDILNNAVHKALWDAFSNNRRPDRAPVRFKLLNNTLEFPVVKPKRNSYEWYIPKGILKRNWINKRVALVPAVVVVFYDMEWNDPQWNEKIIECASRVQSIRAALEGHTTKVAVVVVQGSLSPPPSEYMLGAERAQALCAACEIQSKSLFVLPHGDHLIGYVVRLENAFYDLTQTYYHHETKNIKQHKDHLNKTTHQYLFVRHQFKLGFLNELKQDFNTAHKHYIHAYNNLLETRMVDTNTYEVKTVAGFINYKLCKLLFSLNLPRDAISQLRTHIERYKTRVGVTDLLFEHYAWIARQYSAFGELFDEAIRSGLPAIQSQHPGFYYQQAAQFTVKRRQAMKSVCRDTMEYPSPDPLEGNVEFYGQRPWRPGRLSADPHDPQKEQLAITALQCKERYFNHSAVIISLLGSAISQFKTFHSPRIRKQLVVEMANEYFLCSDYGKALTLLSHMLWDYRREKWWYLASHVLNKALQCAFLSAKVQDYLNLAVEAMSKHILVPNNDKERIYANIMAVLNMSIPNAEPDLPQNSVNNALEVWKTMIEKDPLFVNIEMTSISSFLEIKPRFTQDKFKLDENVCIELYIRMCNPIKLEVKNLYVTILSKTDSIEIPVLEAENPCIILNAGEVKRLICQFKPNNEDSGNNLQIKLVSFIITGEKQRKLVLNFKMDEPNTLNSYIHPELLHFLVGSKNDHEFDGMIPSTVTHIIPRQSNLSVAIVNSSPALQGEWFPTTFQITNNENANATNINIMLSLVNSPEIPNPEAVTELSFSSSNPCPSPLKISLDSINSADTYTNTFFIKSNRMATVTILLKVSYSLLLESRIDCCKDYIIKINVVKPFDVSAKFVSMKFNTIEKCFVDDPFIVMPEIKILSPWDLIIEDAELDLSDFYSFGDAAKPESCIKGLQVSEGTIAADAFCIYANIKPKEDPIRVALFNIKWKRVTKDAVWNSVLSTSSLPSLAIEHCPVTINVEIPEKVQLQESMPIKCTVKGNVPSPTTLSVCVDGSDGYMFAGYKKKSVTVTPYLEEELCYNLYPLVCGNSHPPKLMPLIVKDDVVESNSLVQELFDKTITENVFVIPKQKK